MAGLEAARSRGRMGSRPAGLSKEGSATAKNAKILYDSGEKTVKEIAGSLKISRATCYRYIDIVNEMEKKNLFKMEENNINNVLETKKQFLSFNLRI